MTADVKPKPDLAELKRRRKELEARAYNDWRDQSVVDACGKAIKEIDTEISALSIAGLRESAGLPPEEQTKPDPKPLPLPPLPRRTEKSRAPQQDLDTDDDDEWGPLFEKIYEQQGTYVEDAFLKIADADSHVRSFTQGHYDALLATLRYLFVDLATLARLQRKRRKALEARVTALEANGLKYAGVHQRALSYGKGTVVTFGGSAWIALKDVPEGSAEPGTDDNFQLMVKRGRDGKDAR